MFELVDEEDDPRPYQSYWFDAHALEPGQTKPEDWFPIYPEPCEECGGVLVTLNGNSYYNGSYNCYTQYVCCENCGHYDWECV